MKLSNLLFVVGIGALSACSTSDLTYETTYNTVDRVRVVESIEQTKLPTEEIGGQTLYTLSKYYKAHGDGPIDLTISYDPKDHKKGAAWAARESVALKELFDKHGFGDIQTRIIPVEASPSTAFIRFASVHALPPEDCEGQETPGLYNASEYGRDYKIGCGMRTMFVKQISRKADLKGRTGLDRTRSQRILSHLGELNANPDPQDFSTTFSLSEVDEAN